MNVEIAVALLLIRKGKNFGSSFWHVSRALFAAVKVVLDFVLFATLFFTSHLELLERYLQVICWRMLFTMINVGDLHSTIHKMRQGIQQ